VGWRDAAAAHKAPTSRHARTAAETNVIGAIRVTNAMRSMLRRSASPRIATCRAPSAPSPGRAADAAEVASSTLSAAYAPTKTMLNVVIIQYAKELRDTNFLINAACPDAKRAGQSPDCSGLWPARARRRWLHASGTTCHEVQRGSKDFAGHLRSGLGDVPPPLASGGGTSR